MNELFIKIAAIPLLPVLTVVLIRAVNRNPEIVGLQRPSAVASQILPPRQELEKRLIRCNPQSERTVSLLTDKQLNDAVFACEKS